MKHVYILLVLTILAGAAFPTAAKPVESESLRLQGKVVSVKKSVDGSADVFDLELELEFVNVSEKPIILLRGTYDSGQWWLLSTLLSVEPGNARTVIYSGGTSPSNSRSMSKWGRLRARLNRPTPPKTLTDVIAPGEKVVYRLSTFVKVSGDDRKMLDRNLWVQVSLEMWPLNLEKGFDRHDFRDLLTRRWAKQGILRGDSITSEPITVSLPQ